ncbi:MAG TPA: 2-oxoacid:ferredoxin oxidoreductase subunit gamma [candidate division Zixibacteria bacterium]|nr:2-oxoacid:ferredoxin oxidoreductase subunit gamma [candidate division Zixibacteria bacterium]
MARNNGVTRNGKAFLEDRYEIRLSGSGGQGMITAGVILAEAISVGDNKNAVHTQSYGPEARGGMARCDVVVSSNEIYFPEATELDLLLALTQESVDAYTHLLKPGGVLIVDSDFVKHKPDREYIEVPFVETTREKLGATIATNVVCLGFIAQHTKIVTKKSLESVLVERFPTKFEASNLKAIKLGYDLAKLIATNGNISGQLEESLETEIDRL